jgi:hypothetical protein
MVYATTGAPILANFRINKCEQGSECKALANSLLNIEIAIYGTDQLVQVELISNAGVVKTWNVSSWDFETAFTLNAPLKSAWYYVRARQADTNVVWTSPIWVN